jgi:hypothetical protein
MAAAHQHKTHTRRIVISRADAEEDEGGDPQDDVGDIDVKNNNKFKVCLHRQVCLHRLPCVNITSMKSFTGECNRKRHVLARPEGTSEVASTWAKHSYAPTCSRHCAAAASYKEVYLLPGRAVQKPIFGFCIDRYRCDTRIIEISISVLASVTSYRYRLSIFSADMCNAMSIPCDWRLLHTAEAHLTLVQVRKSTEHALVAYVDL